MKLLHIIILVSTCTLPIWTFADDPLVIVKSGDDATLAGVGLTFKMVSPPALTADNRRAAFVAQLSDDSQTLWFADLQGDGFYDLSLAAQTGDEVSNIEDPSDLNNLVDITPFFGSGLSNTRNVAQIALDTVSGGLAFTARLNSIFELGQEGTGDPALFITKDDGIQLVVKVGMSFTVPIENDFGEQSEEEFVIGGFLSYQFINDRLIFLASSQLGGVGIFEFADNQLKPVLLSPGFNPDKITDPNLGDIRVSSIGLLGLNRNGGSIRSITGTVPIPGIQPIPNSNFTTRNVDVLQFRENANADYRTLQGSWDPVVGVGGFISGFFEASLNANGDVVAKVGIATLNQDNFPVFDPAASAIMHYAKFPPELPIKIVATEEAAIGIPDAGDPESIIITRLDAIQLSGRFLTYNAHYPGPSSNIFGSLAVYRTNLDDGNQGTPLFYIGGSSNVEGLGPISNIIHTLLGPNGDVVVQIITDNNSRRGVVHASPPDVDGNVTYTLLASSNLTSEFICEGDCEGIRPQIPALGFIPGGNVIGPVIGAQTGFGSYINEGNAGYMFNTDPFLEDPREYGVILDFVDFDYGDAPDKELDPAPISVPFGYPEAQHLISPEMSLGAEVDHGVGPGASNLRLRYFAYDDDFKNYQLSNDDEDGVIFTGPIEEVKVSGEAFPIVIDVPVLTISDSFSFEIFANTPSNQAAFINAWIDFNRDGDWEDTGEHIVDDFPVPAGTFVTSFPFENLSIPNEAAAGAGFTFARFRINSVQGFDPAGGYFPDGETEDYLVKLVAPLEYGDAPNLGPDYNYPTLLSANGARHTPSIGDPLLGELADLEFDGIPTENADGDDNNAEDDEDGIAGIGILAPGSQVIITATATLTGKLDAWIDFNGDGDWDDEGEQIFDSIDLSEGANELPVDIPESAKTGNSFARFRISANGNLEPFGLAQGGEVEDYEVRIVESEIRFLQVEPIDGRLLLRWSGLARLEASDDLLEPWEILEDKKNEFWYDPNEDRKFFRLIEIVPSQQ